MSDDTAPLELLKINDEQKAALAAALEQPDRRARGDHRMLAALRRRKLINIHHEITELGRYQVRWYSDDAARAWEVRPDSFGHYVSRGRAPQPDGFEHSGGTTARAWWKPSSILEFDRGPGRGNFERMQIDMQTVIRQYRAGVSIRKIAVSLGVSATVIANRLEEAGEKPTTSSSRTAYRHDQRPTISAESAG